MSASSYRSEGKSILPMSRVQKILKADKELPAIAKEAAFLISIATEEFIKKWSVACHKQAQREERVTLRTQDLAVTVRFEEFMFLDEIVLSDPTVDTNTKSKSRQPRAPKKDKDDNSATTSKEKVTTKGKTKGKGKGKELQPPFAYSVGGLVPAQAVVQNQATLTNMFTHGTSGGAALQFRPAVFTSPLSTQQVPVNASGSSSGIQSNLVPERPELADLNDDDDGLELENELASGRHIQAEEEEEEEEEIEDADVEMGHEEDEDIEMS